MAHPLWAHPGTREGRIAPVHSSAAVGSGYSYGVPYLYYGSYYGLSAHVFCLGRDIIPFSLRRLQIGATASVEQSFVVTTVHKFLLFVWHMRVPTSLPVARTLVSNGSVSFVGGYQQAGCRGLLSPVDGLSGVILDAPGALSQFQLSDFEQWCTISNATDPVNDGTHRIVCPSQDGTEAGYFDRAVLENVNRMGVPAPDTGSMVERLNDPAVTIRVHGLRWVARAYCDWGAGWQARVVLQEPVGRNLIRSSMALHVSQYTGPLGVKFELMLERAE